MSGRGWLKFVIGLALAGFVIVPAAAYLAGQFLAVPYEGDGGLFGYLGSIYAAIWAGQPLALLLVISPTIAALCWILALRLRARMIA